MLDRFFTPEKDDAVNSVRLSDTPGPLPVRTPNLAPVTPPAPEIRTERPSTTRFELLRAIWPMLEVVVAEAIQYAEELITGPVDGKSKGEAKYDIVRETAMNLLRAAEKDFDIVPDRFERLAEIAIDKTLHLLIERLVRRITRATA